MPRFFRVPEGRTLVLPQGVQAGPGATNMRFTGGAVLGPLDDATCTANQRYLNGRLRAGDLEEITEVEALRDRVTGDAPQPEVLPNRDPTKPMPNPTVAMPPKKEG